MLKGRIGIGLCLAAGSSHGELSPSQYRAQWLNCEVQGVTSMMCQLLVHACDCNLAGISLLTRLQFLRAARVAL